MNRLRGSGTDGSFVAGFISAILLLAGVSLVAQAVIWFTSNPQPEAFMQFLQTARFSLIDVFGVLAIVMILIVVLIFPAYMPYNGGSHD